MGWWKEVPYRGEPPDENPKARKLPKSRKEQIREIIISIGVIVGCMALFFLIIYFDPHYPREQNLKIAVFGLGMIILMMGLSVGINAWNKYLRGFPRKVRPKEKREE